MLQEAVQASRLEHRLPTDMADLLDASTNGELLVTGELGGSEASIWDPVSGQRLRSLSGPVDRRPATLPN